jgi:hypothetical protein
MRRHGDYRNVRLIIRSLLNHTMTTYGQKTTVKGFFGSFIVRLGLFAVLSAVPGVYSFSHADENQGDGSYTVKQGDTLWGISKELLGDPNAWPKIWQENPSIANPNSLRPGLRISIPRGLAGGAGQKVVELPIPPPKEVKNSEGPSRPKEIEIPVSDARTTFDRLLILKGGYIADKENVLGSIVAAPTDRELFARGDFAYVNTTVDTTVKFYIVRMKLEIKHPITKEFMGYVASYRGVLEVIGKEGGYKKAVIREVFNDIDLGDLLIPYYELDRPQISNKEKPEAKGVIVGNHRLSVASATGDIVYIDKGRDDGIEIGDIFTVTASIGSKRPLGKLEVIAMQHKTATARIISGNSEMRAGDTF